MELLPEFSASLVNKGVFFALLLSFAAFFLWQAKFIVYDIQFYSENGWNYEGDSGTSVWLFREMRASPYFRFLPTGILKVGLSVNCFIMGTAALTFVIAPGVSPNYWAPVVVGAILLAATVPMLLRDLAFYYRNGWNLEKHSGLAANSSAGGGTIGSRIPNRLMFILPFLAILGAALVLLPFVVVLGGGRWL